jgi:hypothetical protein
MLNSESNFLQRRAPNKTRIMRKIILKPHKTKLMHAYVNPPVFAPRGNSVADKGWSLRLRTGLHIRTPNAELRTLRRSPRSGCPTNPIHDRLAETKFRYRLNEDPLDVQLVHLSQQAKQSLGRYAEIPGFA